jgi:hypothetical protein
MDIQILSLIAGTISSFIFASSNVPMLWKAYKTRDLHSYSLLNIVLVNAGNLLYWWYVVNLPLGPVWILHSFYTVASVILLYLYARYNLSISVRRAISRLWGRIRGVVARRVRLYPNLQPSHHLYSSCWG